MSEQHLLQNSPQGVTEAALVVASNQEHAQLPPRVEGFSRYLELCFSGQVEVMTTIRMSLMPYLASALFLKWEDQTTGSSFLAWNMKLGFTSSTPSEKSASLLQGGTNC